MKKPWLSKTLWINFFMASFALFFPAGSTWMETNSGLVLSIFAVVNIVLRLVTKEQISLTE